MKIHQWVDMAASIVLLVIVIVGGTMIAMAYATKPLPRACYECDTENPSMHSVLPWFRAIKINCVSTPCKEK